jgi:hypothetical protein
LQPSIITDTTAPGHSFETGDKSSLTSSTVILLYFSLFSCCIFSSVQRQKRREVKRENPKVTMIVYRKRVRCNKKFGRDQKKI